MNPGEAGTITANTSSTIMNIDAVIGRLMPNERRVISNGRTAKVQIRIDVITMMARWLPRNDNLIPPMNEPSIGMIRSEKLFGNGFNRNPTVDNVR